jgi:hypothetical protein
LPRDGVIVTAESEPMGFSGCEKAKTRRLTFELMYSMVMVPGLNGQVMGSELSAFI